MPKKVLITGASGFLASKIIDQLRANFDLTLLDKNPPSQTLSGFKYIEADITDLAALKQACEGQDAVVHTVALVRGRENMPPGLFADVMVKGMWHLAEACQAAGVKRLVNISSITASGWPPRPADAAPLFNKGDLFYSLAKHLAENICLAYAQTHELSVVNLRPGIIHGDGTNPGPVKPENGDADANWFLYVDARDVAQSVEGALLASLPPGACRTYSILAGRKDAVLDWTDAAKEIGYAPQWNWPEIPVEI